MRILFVLALTLLPGCATIVNGTTQSLTFVTNPPGATVELSSHGIYGTTPCTLDVPRGSKTVVAYFTKDGYVPRTEYLEASLSPWMWGNLFSLTGLFIDLITDAWHDYAEPEDEYRLTKSVTTAAARVSP